MHQANESVLGLAYHWSHKYHIHTRWILRQTVHTHRASVHQATKLAAALLRVVRVTAGLAKSNGSLPPGLWLTSPAGWLPRTGISSGSLHSAIEYGLPLPFYTLSKPGANLTEPSDLRISTRRCPIHRIRQFLGLEAHTSAPPNRITCGSAVLHSISTWMVQGPHHGDMGSNRGATLCAWR